MHNITIGSPILIVSLGDSRPLTLRLKDNPENVVSVEMQAGSLFLLGPLTNSSWQHAVPVVSHAVGPRISMIFRDIATEIDTKLPKNAAKIWAE